MENKNGFWDKVREQTGLQRVGESWTKAEETLVLSKISAGKNADEISKDLQRTTGSINSRLKQIAFEMFTQQVPYEKIQEVTTISRAHLQEIVDKKGRKKEHSTEEKINDQPITRSEFMELKCLLNEIKDILKDKNF
jgi:hypothetical protein